MPQSISSNHEDGQNGFARVRRMNTLVTGGAGFIGSNLARQLLAEGHSVTILDNLQSGYRANLEALPQARFIEGDVRDAETVMTASRGADCIFHLAASVGNKRSMDMPIDDAQINVLGTLNVLEAARKLGIKKVVFSSSAGIFGELKALPIGEDHPVEPDSPYGASKLGAEKAGLAYAKLYKIEFVSLRYFNVYGPNQRLDPYGNVIPIFVFRMLRGEPLTILGDGEQTRDFVNVDDVVQANIGAALAPGVWGAFNIGSGTRISINCLVEKLANLSGLCPEVHYAPPRAGDVRHSLANIEASATAFGFHPSRDMDGKLTKYLKWASCELNPRLAAV
jgi:UDP-glucose 4-epimerase